MSDSKGMDDVGSDAVASDSAGGGSRSDSDGGGTPRRSRTRTRSGAGGDKRAVGDLGAAVGDEEDFDERFNPPPTEPDDSLVELCTAQGISDTTLHRKPHTVEYVDLFQCHAVEMRSLQYFRNLREVILIQLPRVDCIEGLEWCPLIERLWISECNLRVIEGLDKCSKLRLLNLDSNRITRIQNLGNCTALETLWINDNRLKSLEGVSEIKGLRTLWAARNSLTAIGTALDRNTCLTSLNVADNGIGYFKEIHNLARVPSLRHLCFSEPHFGDNPVCNLCNYQTYVLYQLPHVDTLDTVTLADDSKQLAEATYIKKKMYYNMRIKTLKRNTTNVIRRATEALQGRIGQINLSFNVLLRQKRDVERLMDEWKWTKEHGRAAVGCLEDAEAGDPDEEWLEQLRIKHEALQEATSHKTREVTRIDTQFARLKERLLGISEQNVTRMIVELGTGGNIRLEDGKASDVWFTSCVDLLHSRFFHRDFLPLGVSGVKVHRVTRVHNRFLRNRFDQRMSHLMTAIPSLSVGSSGSGSGGDSGRPARRSLEYLFFAPQVPALSSPTYASAELQRIAQEGFTERHLTGRAPVPPLRRTAGFRADQHVSYAQHHRRFAKRVEEERLAAIERDEEEDSASEESRDSDAPDEAPGVLLSNSLSFADMPRLCDSVAGAMEHGGGWSRGAAAAAGGASAPRGHGPIIGPEERPDVWLNRAGIDLERASTKFQLEHMRKSTEAASQGASRAAAAGTGSGGEAGASGNASMRLDAPEVSEGVIMIAKVFLGQCQSLDTSGRPASREADAKAKPADPTADGWHSACRPRSDDPKQRQWVVLDTALALPEYIIEFEYEWEPVLALPGGPGSGPQVPAATVTSELAALAEMSAGMGAASESDKPAPVRLTPQAEADLRPLVRPLAKFVSECREAARRGGASGGGSGGPPSGADGDFTMHALDLPPVLRSRTKISAITDSVLLGGLPASTPLDRLLIVNLHGNSIRVIEGLDALASLRVLVLSFNEIQRIGGLASLVKLERLDLGFNLIKRVEGLDGLESLRQLDLNNNLLYQLEDIQVLRRCCPDLQRLNLRNNGVCELKSYRSLVLRRMPSLEVLDGRPVSDADREEAAACATHITPQLILRYGRSGTGGHVSADLAGGGGARRSSPDEGGKEAKGGAGTGDDDDVVDAIRGGMGNEWFDEVETLDLSHMRLRRISSMDRLSRLVRLNLADNEISVIEGLDSLGVLEELSLEENRISKLEGLDNLRFLKKLDLGKNRISKVDGIAALTQLSQLSLEDNELSSLEGLAALPALMELYIGNNHIDSIKQILALKDLPKLIILDLSGNPLCSHATYRLYTVYHLRRLKVLDGVGVDSAEQASAKDKYSGRLTAEFLEEKIGHSYFEAIRELDLASCRIREIETLSGESFRCLSYLNLDHNQMTGTSLAGLTGLPHLAVLRLNHNRISSLLPEHGPEVALAVAVAQGKRDDGAEETAPTVGAFSRLEVLQLGFNQITDITALGLHRMPALKVLYLQGNDISRVVGLETCHSLRELVLDKNRIKYLDAGSFVGLVALRELRMQENGLRSLSNFQTLESLQVLALGYNRISDLPELDKLATLPSLTELWLANNPVARKQLYRPGLIKRLVGLRVLDGREIAVEERERAELLFASEHRPSPVYVQDTRPVPGKVPVKLTAVNFESLTGYGSRGGGGGASSGGSGGQQPTTVAMALGGIGMGPVSSGGMADGAQLIGRPAPSFPVSGVTVPGAPPAGTGRGGGRRGQGYSSRSGAASPRYGRR